MGRIQIYFFLRTVWHIEKTKVAVGATCFQLLALEANTGHTMLISGVASKGKFRKLQWRYGCRSAAGDPPYCGYRTATARRESPAATANQQQKWEKWSRSDWGTIGSACG